MLYNSCPDDGQKLDGSWSIVRERQNKIDNSTHTERGDSASSDSELLPGAPLYLQLADILREKIYSHEWPPQSRIPSEFSLMGRFGIARGTVRKALKMLVDEGLLVQVRGSGTFVAEPGISHPAGVRPLSFADSLRAQGKVFETRVIEKRVEEASVSVAGELGVSPGELVMFMRRVRTVEGSPIMCQESWLNLGECPGLFDIDYTSESLFNAVQKCSGRKITTSHMRYSARTAGREYASLLECGEAAALLLLEQHISLEDGAVIEWTDTWFNPGQTVEGTAVQSA